MILAFKLSFDFFEDTSPLQSYVGQEKNKPGLTKAGNVNHNLHIKWMKRRNENEPSIVYKTDFFLYFFFNLSL